MNAVSKLITKAIEMFGSEKSLAEAAGVSQPVINAAKNTGRVGPKAAAGIDRATKGQVPKSKLRPDLWSSKE